MAFPVSSTSPPSTRPPQARTNIGPLTTTTWNPPSACMTGMVDYNGGKQLWLGAQCVPAGPGLSYAIGATTCWPPTSLGATGPTSSQFAGWGFYSPGLVCPPSYHSACTATAGGHSDWPVQFLLTQGETAVGCCPSGFECTRIYNGIGNQFCTSTAPPGKHVAVSECFADAHSTFASFALPGDVVVDSSTFYAVKTFGLYAPMLQINWRSSDREAAAATSTSTQSSSSTHSHGQDSLSTGTKAAIGVVIPAVVIAAIVGLIVFYRHRRRRGTSSSPTSQAQWPSPPVSEVRRPMVPETDAVDSARYELQHPHQVHELGGAQRHELDGRRVGG